MTPDNIQAPAEFLDRFEQQLTEQLLRICTMAQALSGQLLETPDLEAVWPEICTPYLGDAVPEIAKYPTVAIGWMGFVGLAMAQRWDSDWTTAAADPHALYPALLAQGFDALDDYVLDHVLAITDAEERTHLHQLVRTCAEAAHAALRHEGIEPQSPMAFHTYVRTLHVMFRIGVALQLRRLGYKFEKIDMK